LTKKPRNLFSSYIFQLTCHKCTSFGRAFSITPLQQCLLQHYINTTFTTLSFIVALQTSLL
jgi:hypothetical protein